MAKWQKKQKLYDVGDNKENTFYNSFDTLNNKVTEMTQEPPKSTNNSELMLDMALQLDQIEEQDTTRGSLEINTQVTNLHRGE
ncbi:9886_t:CDS:2 [Gigaspora margarita]|uniref:9886_t:CDS:1 n=1 Tax=Gigaspora margarita TaxID=4874 RepID=A0ABN7W3C7_GIGMA|nr:9886_t:CDS:2 [Gigaspora margarita]